MNHRQQVDESIVRSLEKAGIRARYHHQQLDRHPSPYAAELLDWVLGVSKQEASCGYTLVGGNEIEDLAILLARGLHLTGRTMKVMNAMRFQRLLSEERKYLNDDTAPAGGLLLTQCGPLDPKEPAIFTARETRTMEDWLGDWIADGRRLLIHTPRPLAGGWFSAALLQRVAAVNETLIEDKA